MSELAEWKEGYRPNYQVVGWCKVCFVGVNMVDNLLAYTTNNSSSVLITASQLALRAMHRNTRGTHEFNFIRNAPDCVVAAVSAAVSAAAAAAFPVAMVRLLKPLPLQWPFAAVSEITTSVGCHRGRCVVGSPLGYEQGIWEGTRSIASSGHNEL